jgi:hypothetical protein
MSGKLARRTHNFIKRTVGTVGTLPRIINLDKGPLDVLGNPTGLSMYGYIDVNEQATTPFSRGKVHKGWFCCQSSEMSHGDLVLDRADNNYYFVMSMKDKRYNDETVYIDGTMYFCDRQVTVSRFSDGVRDTFGRVVSSAPTVVATNINCMFNPMNFDVLQQEDRLIAQDKIKVCFQAKVGVKVADRITAPSGKKYIVMSVDDSSLANLVLCAVDEDVR